LASSKTAVLSAVLGNSVLTVLKVGAWLVSGSGAMLAEAVHSFADAANQALLWAGMNRSQRPADQRFHYGYGGEQFLFALLAAVGIFVLGCGVTVYHGVHAVMHPQELEVGWLTFGVLGFSLILDGWVLSTAYRAIHAQKGSQSLRTFLKKTTDPSVVAVFLEDAVATAGVIVAMVCIGIAHWTGDARWDGFGSILIGLMMGGIAIRLGVMNRDLLLGHALEPSREQEVLACLEQEEAVEAVRGLKTRVLASGEFKLQADIDFDGRVLGARLAEWAGVQCPEGRTGEDWNAFCSEFGEEMTTLLAQEVDQIEERLRARFPELVFMDLETD